MPAPVPLSPWPSAPSAQNDLEEVETSPSGRYVRYNILLGKGACKRVYKAFDTEEGTEVAWNQVDLLGMDRDAEAQQHLHEEIRVLQKLKHKNIMTFFAWWQDDVHKHVNFITELFTAGNLRQYRKKLRVMSENVLKRWSHQILEGLLYLHGHVPPIVHRDLKCDNIFVNSATGEIKIGDLGLATVQQQGMSVVGTPEFMAPEVYDESYDERCDIYSFGMCLLELATLEYPYAECHSVPQIFKKVTLGIPPASLARVTSPDLRDFITICIAHDPADRPSARELLKHRYLESVRLGDNSSHGGIIHSGSMSGTVPGGALASAGSCAGSGWTTPTGTVHCAASFRDLRDALHQHETLARAAQQHLMMSSMPTHPLPTHTNSMSQLLLSHSHSQPVVCPQPAPPLALPPSPSCGHPIGAPPSPTRGPPTSPVEAAARAHQSPQTRASCNGLSVLVSPTGLARSNSMVPSPLGRSFSPLSFAAAASPGISTASSPTAACAAAAQQLQQEEDGQGAQPSTPTFASRRLSGGGGDCARALFVSSSLSRRNAPSPLREDSNGGGAWEAAAAAAGGPGPSPPAGQQQPLAAADGGPDMHSASYVSLQKKPQHLQPAREPPLRHSSRSSLGGRPSRRSSGCSGASGNTEDDSEDDSDEEVLVPIELLKAGLMDEGFVDDEGDEGCAGYSLFAQNSAGSEPSVISLIDPRVLTAASGGVIVARQPAPASQVFETIAEHGDGSDDAAAAAVGGSASGVEREAAARVSTAGGRASSGDGAQEGTALYSLDLNPKAQKQYSQDRAGADNAAPHGGSGGGASRPGSGRVSSSGGASANAGGSYNGAVAGSPTSASGFGSGSSGIVAAGSSPAAAHHRCDSSCDVTFNAQGPSDPSGIMTPALRMSLNGLPLPPLPSGLCYTSPSHGRASYSGTITTTTTSTRPHLPPGPATPGLGSQSMPTPAAPTSATPAIGSQSMPTRGSPSSVAKLPSFRNKVTVTAMMPSSLLSTGSSISATSSPALPPPPAGRFLRTSSARGIGSLRSTTSDIPGPCSPSLQPSGTAGGGRSFRASAGGDPTSGRSQPRPLRISGVDGAAGDGAAGLDGDGEQRPRLERTPSQGLSTMAAGPGSSGVVSRRSSIDTELPPLGASGDLLGLVGDPRALMAVLASGADGASAAAGAAADAGAEVDEDDGDPLAARFGRASRLAHHMGLPSLAEDAAEMAPRSPTAAGAGAASGAVDYDTTCLRPPPVVDEATVPSAAVEVVREFARPIQGVIMRLKQWKRLARDRARALRV